MKHNSFFKNVITLASGSIVAQIIMIICSPITTRLFTPEEIGVFTLITTGVTIFSPIISLRYEISIVSESELENALSLLQLSTILCGIFSFIVTIGYMLYFSISLNYDYNPFLMSLIVFILIFITGIINILISFNNRMSQYQLITKLYIIRTGMQNIFMILFGVFKFGALGLMSSQVVGLLFGLKSQIGQLENFKNCLIKIDTSKLKYVAEKHKKQVIWSTPATLLNGLSYSSMNYFISFLFGEAVLGLYSISYRILGLPLSVVSTNISKVYFEKASKEYSEIGNSRKTFFNTVIFSIILAIPMGIVMYCFSPNVFKIIFGESWYQSGVIVSIMTPMVMIRFVASSVNVSTIISNKQNIDLFMQIILLIAALLVFGIAYLFQLNVNGYLKLANSVISFIYIIYIFVLYSCIKGEK